MPRGGASAGIRHVQLVHYTPNEIGDFQTGTITHQGLSGLLKKSLAAAGEDGIVAVVERELDLDRAVVLQFGRSVAGDLIAFVKAAPAEEDDGLGVFDLAAGGDASEGKFRPPVAADLKVGRLDHIEIVAVPQIGFDNLPTANQFTHCRAGHGAAASNLGARTRL